MPRERFTYKDHRRALEARILARASRGSSLERRLTAQPGPSSLEDPSGGAVVVPARPGGPVSPQRAVLPAIRTSHPPALKLSLRPRSRTSVASNHSSGEDSLPGAPPPMNLDDLFGLDEAGPGPRSPRGSPSEPEFEDLPTTNSPRLHNFLIGPVGGPHPEFREVIPYDPIVGQSPKVYLARLPVGPIGPHGTPPQKSIVRGDHFLESEERAYFAGMPGYSPTSPIKSHLFDIGFTARAQISPEQRLDGLPDHQDDLITAADMVKRGAQTSNDAATGPAVDVEGPVPLPPDVEEPRPLPPDIEEPPPLPPDVEEPQLLPPADSPSAPRTPSHTRQVPHPPHGRPRPVQRPSPQPSPSLVPDSQEASADTDNSTDPSPLTRFERRGRSPRALRSPDVSHAQAADSGHSGQPPSQRRRDGPRAISLSAKGTPNATRRAPRRAASSALAGGAFAGAQADSDTPDTDDEFCLSNSPVKEDMKLFDDELVEDPAANHFANDDDDYGAQPHSYAKPRRTSRDRYDGQADYEAHGYADGDSYQEAADSPPRATRKEKGKGARKSRTDSVGVPDEDEEDDADAETDAAADHSPPRATQKQKAKATRKSRNPSLSQSDEAEETDHDGDDSNTRGAPIRKGKRGRRNASAGPSHPSRGRPTIEVNQEIEEVAHRMQAELVSLGHKVGLSYETLLRKMGFTQQEVRDPNISNVFKQVHKERLRASGQRE